jgi:hypothetical protein
MLSSNVIADFTLAKPTPKIGVESARSAVPVDVATPPILPIAFANPIDWLALLAVSLAIDDTRLVNSSEFKIKSRDISPTDVAIYSHLLLCGLLKVFKVLKIKNNPLYF